MNRWRAAEHLANYIYKNPDIFKGKTVCELGAGLGLVSVLLSKLKVVNALITTDGDDDTIELLTNNIEKVAQDDDSVIITKKLYWDLQVSEFLTDIQPIISDSSITSNSVDAANNKCLFDIVLGADIIYEDEQLVPLFSTVTQILRRKYYYLIL